MGDLLAEKYCEYLKGDGDAFAGIVDELGQPLVFFLYGFVGSVAEAEDLMEETLAELIVRPNAFRGKASLKTYLYRIARNKALNAIKRRRRIAPLDEELADLKQLESEFLAKERSRELYRATERLPRDYRTALHLVYFEQMSYREAAAVMRKSEKQVDNLVARAKRKCRQILEQEGFRYEE